MKEPPQAQGGIQALGKGDGVDVPVNMLYKFLQLSEFLVPPVQFFDRVWDIPVMLQRRHALCSSWYGG